METTANVLANAHELYARSGASSATTSSRPPAYKAVGISLAIASGVFIGTSFVLKKKGLLAANIKYSEEAGEGYGYLKNVWWWTGMTLMIIGEICNFVAYAFVDAILVTPLGALSVVITTILSAIFLKERLSFVGKVGCVICIIGSIIIVMNAPSQSSAGTIQEMKHFVIAPGFLSYTGVVVVGCLFIIFWVGPRYGKKSMLVYLSVCSLIGGLSVVATQGLGAAVVAQAAGKPQFNQWFLYVLFVFVIATLVTEIIYLNKALNLFNAALVTPTYYVFFTSSTIVTSAILFRGFKGSPTAIATIVMGFLQICCGVVLLQLSKSAKDVSEVEIFKDDFDQVRTIAEQEQPESEPKADAIRGTAAIIRRISVARQKWEAEEAKRVHEDKLKDLEPIGEDEAPAEWDGLRRRPTISSRDGPGSIARRKTLRPPLGMTKFPDPEPEHEDDMARPSSEPNPNWNVFGSVRNSVRNRARSVWLPGQKKNLGGGTPTMTPTYPVPLTDISVPDLGYKGAGDSTPALPGTFNSPFQGQQEEHVYGLPEGLKPPRGRFRRGLSTDQRSPREVSPAGGVTVHWTEDDTVEKAARSAPILGETLRPPPPPPPHTAKRQFSFQNVFGRRHSNVSSNAGGAHDENIPTTTTASRIGLGSRQSSKNSAATEEERLGLVKGDSRSMLALPDYVSSDEEDGKAKPYSDKAAELSSPTTTTAAGYRPDEPLTSPLPMQPTSPRSPTAGMSPEKELEYYEEQKQRWRKSRELERLGKEEGRPLVPVRSEGVREKEEEERERERRARGGGGERKDGGGGGGGSGAFI